MIGTDTGGTMNGFPMNECNGIGRAGELIGIGKDRRPGTSTTINLGRNNKKRSYDSKGNGNINRGQRFSNLREKSIDLKVRHKDNLGFSNPGEKSIDLKVNHKDNLRFSNLRDNPNNSINLRAGDRIPERNHNPKSHTENLKG